MFGVAFAAQQQSNGRVLAFLHVVFLQVFQIEFHLAFVLRLELPELQVDGHQAFQATMVEKQVQIIVGAVHRETFLALKEGETLSLPSRMLRSIFATVSQGFCFRKRNISDNSSLR